MPKKKYNDDDGRTIANMDNVSPPNLFSFRLPPGYDNNQYPKDQEKKEKKEKSREILSKEERKWYVLGALKATFLIGLAFLVGLALVIVLILFFGRAYI